FSEELQDGKININQIIPLNIVQSAPVFPSAAPVLSAAAVIPDPSSRMLWQDFKRWYLNHLRGEISQHTFIQDERMIGRLESFKTPQFLDELTPEYLLDFKKWLGGFYSVGGKAGAAARASLVPFLFTALFVQRAIAVIGLAVYYSQLAIHSADFYHQIFLVHFISPSSPCSFVLDCLHHQQNILSLTQPLHLSYSAQCILFLRSIQSVKTLLANPIGAGFRFKIFRPFKILIAYFAFNFHSISSNGCPLR
ncbi:MAG: hypothetical protein LBG46_02785, partial [Elusimicrobiota bacterium]|nr:hypothetical protein [Elusimicrobiota bacterium]